MPRLTLSAVWTRFSIALGIALLVLFAAYYIKGDIYLWISVSAEFVLMLLGAVVALEEDWAKRHRNPILAVFVIAGLCAMIATIKISQQSTVAETKLSTSIDDLAGASRENLRVSTLNTQLQERLMQQSDTIEFLARQNISASKLVEIRQLKTEALDLARGIQGLAANVATEQSALPRLPIAHSLEEFRAQSESSQSKDRDSKEWQIFHNAIAEYNQRYSSSVKDVLAEFKKETGWESKECSTSLGPYTIIPIAQFLYVEGCGQDLEREANTLP